MPNFIQFAYFQTVRYQQYVQYGEWIEICKKINKLNMEPTSYVLWDNKVSLFGTFCFQFSLKRRITRRGRTKKTKKEKEEEKKPLKRATCYHLQFAPLFNSRIWLDIQTHSPKVLAMYLEPRPARKAKWTERETPGAAIRTMFSRPCGPGITSRSNCEKIGKDGVQGRL